MTTPATNCPPCPACGLRRLLWSLVVDALAWRWCGTRAWLWAICRLSDATEWRHDGAAGEGDPFR